MQQMLSQHVGKKQIDPAVMRAAMRSYIEQFDPYRIYLLEEEVRPYFYLSDAMAKDLYDKYLLNDFSEFTKLNTKIQQSIERSRKLRKEFEDGQQAELFLPGNSLREDWRNTGPQHPFAINLLELRARIKMDIIQFIASEKQRFGVESVMNNKKHTLVMYNNDMERVENEYMSVNDKGVPIPAAKQENLLALHILKALASNLDAHTKFFDSREAYDMKVRLEKGFQGVGLELQERPEGIMVSGLVKNGPAEKSGKIKVKDLITAIDSKNLDTESFEEVLSMLRGPNGTTVQLTLKRPGESNNGVISVNLQRAPIAVHEGRVDTSYETYENGIIARVALHSFYQGESNINSENDVKDAIVKLKKIGNLKGLILDLRDNTGGFLMQAVKVAGLFMSKGVVVISKYSNGEEHFYRDTDSTEYYEGPLIILTSKETASAAEIVTQALQDYGLALVVGDDHTFGKGTIQSQTITSNGASSLFKVTVGTYYTVSGKSPQNKGVKADITVPSPLSQEEIGEQFLPDTVEAKNISPAFEDQLVDVEPSMKPWYMHHYMPQIQHIKHIWRDMIPTLKKNSESRMAQNTMNYNAFIQKHFGTIPRSKHSSDDPENNLEKISTKDLQVGEAVNILKDMITLQSHLFVGAPS